jgi:hypothetical protein
MTINKTPSGAHPATTARFLNAMSMPTRAKVSSQSLQSVSSVARCIMKGAGNG